MSLMSVSQAAQSASLRDRIAACVSEQIASGSYVTDQHPVNEASRIIWLCAAEPGWGPAWESAEAGSNPDPGADPAVITDAQILTAVQKHLGVTEQSDVGVAE